MCPTNDVEGETIEAEDIAGTVVETIDKIKSVISEKTEVTSKGTVVSREENTSKDTPTSRESITSHESPTTSDDIMRTKKTGAPELVSSHDARSGSPPGNDVIKLPTLKPKLPKIELRKFSGDVTKFFPSGRASKVPSIKIRASLRSTSSII